MTHSLALRDVALDKRVLLGGPSSPLVPHTAISPPSTCEKMKCPGHGNLTSAFACQKTAPIPSVVAGMSLSLRG